MAFYDGKSVEESTDDVTPSSPRDVENGDARVIDPDSGVKRGLKNRHLSRYSTCTPGIHVRSLLTVSLVRSLIRTHV